ncbi:MAG: YkgJ family cysteine cluster protein [Desulfobacterales bacterium]|nr:YkgJ family cysteine cluster protein [Desulfobacterales bacterium]
MGERSRAGAFLKSGGSGRARPVNVDNETAVESHSPWRKKRMDEKTPATPGTPGSGEKARACARCGTCCRKEGPAFHWRDKELIQSGAIQLKHLYTIRKGELARDNVREALVPVRTDVIKIKGRKGAWSCMFFIEEENACAIYRSRPLECRVLKCWDTTEIRDIYEKDRLTRKDLLADMEGIWELIESHEERCAYDRIRPLARAARSDKNHEFLNELLYIIRYDHHIRDLMTSRGKMDPEMLDFLLGRPLTETIRAFGLKLTPDGKGVRVLSSEF